MLSILDQEWNNAIEAAAKDCERMALALRSANGDSEEWVWPAANSMDEEAGHIRRLKRTVNKDKYTLSNNEEQT